MLQYVSSFIVYTLAMIGVLLIGFITYKKTIPVSPTDKNSNLKIKDALRLPDRKLLYVIECKNEEFLIASSTDGVTLISKLDNNIQTNADKYIEEKTYQCEEENKDHVLKSLLKELSDKNKKRSNS